MKQMDTHKSSTLLNLYQQSGSVGEKIFLNSPKASDLNYCGTKNTSSTWKSSLLSQSISLFALNYRTPM